MIKKLLSKSLILKFIQAQEGFYRENIGNISHSKSEIYYKQLVGDEICWRQLCDVGDQQPKDVTNIEILSLTAKNCHQL